MQELRKWFKNNPFPDKAPELNISDTRNFLNSHFNVINGNCKQRFKDLHQERLENLKQHLIDTNYEK
jgi:hypothetical protein